jgi:hypothetical protein
MFFGTLLQSPTNPTNRMTLEQALAGVRPIDAPNMPTVSLNSDQSLLPALNYPDEYFIRPEKRALELTAAERDLLGRLVYAEARGEGELGQAAVANSILNRWLSVREGLSPGTFNARGKELDDIIFARGQYQPAREGKLGKPLDPKSRELVDRAIDLALNPEKFRQKLAQAGKTSSEIDRIMAATGFRAHYAFSDSSQKVNTVKLGGHLFNAAGNRGARSFVSERVKNANSAPFGFVTDSWLDKGAYLDLETPVQPYLEYYAQL